LITVFAGAVMKGKKEISGWLRANRYSSPLSPPFSGSPRIPRSARQVQLAYDQERVHFIILTEKIASL